MYNTDQSHSSPHKSRSEVRPAELFGAGRARLSPPAGREGTAAVWGGEVGEVRGTWRPGFARFGSERWHVQVSTHNREIVRACVWLKFGSELFYLRGCLRSLVRSCLPACPWAMWFRTVSRLSAVRNCFICLCARAT